MKRKHIMALSSKVDYDIGWRAGYREGCKDSDRYCAQDFLGRMLTQIQMEKEKYNNIGICQAFEHLSKVLVQWAKKNSVYD
jgi:hypothetical protein